MSAHSASPDLRERLAAIEHEQWMAWSKTLAASENLSSERIVRWTRLWVPYAELRELDREFDREWADKVLAALQASPAPENEEIVVRGDLDAQWKPVYRVGTRWHHSPDAPPEHFCEDCDAMLRLHAEMAAKIEELQASPAPLDTDRLARLEHIEAAADRLCRLAETGWTGDSEQAAWRGLREALG